MRSLLTASVLGVAWALATAASAQAAQQVYRWTDSAGVVHFGDAPPAHTSASVIKVDGQRTPPAAPASLPSLEGDPAALAQAEQAARARNCSKARTNLATLQGKQMIVDGADLTKAHRMSADDQAAEKQKADGDIALYCGEGQP